jgi:Protein of unknown function (DUF664)
VTIERTEPLPSEDDRTMLRHWLDYHRATLERKCDGLDAGQLRTRSVPPSSMSLLGIVRHMAEVERRWFLTGLAGEAMAPRYFDDVTNPDGDFDDVDDADPDEAFTYWREECARARAIEASFTSLDDHRRDPRRDIDLSVRWVMLHMLEEYARHNGHADLLRERIDGATGE